MRTAAFPLIAAYAFLSACMAPTTHIAAGDPAAVAAEREEQYLLSMETMANREQRLDVLSRPILRANVELCPETSYKIGFRFGSEYLFDEDARSAARRLYGFANRLGVMAVFPDTPADRAGMRVGDALLAINGDPLPTIGSRRQHNAAVQRVTKQYLVNTPTPVTFRVARGEQELTYTAAPELLCGYPVALINDDDLNAYADGGGIYVTTGLMRFVDNDEELQAVVAHELAHNTEGHVKKRTGNAAIAGIFGALIDIAAATQGVATNTTGTFMQAGAQAFSQDFEREADYVSVYMLQRAGIDTGAVAHIWRRMAVESPGSIRFASSHPTSAERFVNLNAAHNEATEKRLRQLPLLPQRDD